MTGAAAAADDGDDGGDQGDLALADGAGLGLALWRESALAALLPDRLTGLPPALPSQVPVLIARVSMAHLLVALLRLHARAELSPSSPGAATGGNSDPTGDLMGDLMGDAMDEVAAHGWCRSVAAALVDRHATATAARAHLADPTRDPTRDPAPGPVSDPAPARPRQATRYAFAIAAARLAVRRRGAALATTPTPTYEVLGLLDGHDRRALSLAALGDLVTAALAITQHAHGIPYEQQVFAVETALRAAQHTPPEEGSR